MSTIGHPLSDLVNLVFQWITADNSFGIPFHPAFSAGKGPPGHPTMGQVVHWYQEVAGWNAQLDLPWGTAFGLFRTAIVMQGIGARYALRQASDSASQARAYGLQAGPYANFALHHVKRVKRKLEERPNGKGKL